jgi:aminoglycoside 3-N-acetyltransferase
MATAGIRSGLAGLGMPPGSPVLVHSSLRQLGPLTCGPATVVDALRDVLGPRSTIVVPAFTARNSTTTREYRRRTADMTPGEREAEEARIVPFDLSRTPAQDVGAFAEHIRSLPTGVRSAHPQTSFAAVGPDAADLTRDHALDCHLGERSPLARLYELDAGVLLLGVDFDVCTAFHLAEHRLPWPAPWRSYRAYVLQDGLRTRCDFEAPEADDRDFGRIGKALREGTGVVRTGVVGDALASWVPLREAVDFAGEWLTRSRAGEQTDRCPEVV